MKKDLKAEDLNKKQIISLMGFRKRKSVELIFKRTIARCPTCKRPIDVEYINYCTCCGQKLDWKHYSKIVFKNEIIQQEYEYLYDIYSDSLSHKEAKIKALKGMKKLIKKGAKIKK